MPERRQSNPFRVEDEPVKDEVWRIAEWYNRQSLKNGRFYHVLKVLQFIAAAAIPVAAGQHAPAVITGSLGGVIAVMEGAQQVMQFQERRLGYRVAHTALLRELRLYSRKAGDYTKARSPDQLLIERTVDVLGQEHQRWLSSVQQSKAEKVVGE